jgi:hypothetical protein
VSHERRETTEDENGQCVRAPGEDSTGAGAERELGFGPQSKSKAELAQGEGEYKGAREVLARHTYTPPLEPRGGPLARGGAKDPTGDSAELDVLF